MWGGVHRASRDEPLISQARQSRRFGRLWTLSSSKRLKRRKKNKGPETLFQRVRGVVVHHKGTEAQRSLPSSPALLCAFPSLWFKGLVVPSRFETSMLVSTFE